MSFPEFIVIKDAHISFPPRDAGTVLASHVIILCWCRLGGIGILEIRVKVSQRDGDFDSLPGVIYLRGIFEASFRLK